MSEVIVIARAHSQPGREDEMEQALTTNATASREEGGCVSYSVARGDNGLFMTIERWRTRADFDQHMATPHVQTLLGTISPMLAAPPDIQVLREV